ncbi:DUF3926 domain-containing protein [Bacillus sp. Xin]|uniref:DUF3926 domain-containing protein n=1 Tax=unclassified Bacillus (in: firmicutes) TaxID=185979 RepID=UPI001571F90F|nr:MULTISPECIES: DUF3926 domain-containing protein [unclassified Bacillus (in: firmicutes)]MBC6971815.1 DUF3926 domain-containing protein [Bacillus sp. Xin]MCI0766293.1 DUF3926 domain-containing protein [Bacillus sp. TL12]NSW37964.1 DUF3926 domain-containing protein [Bacillus sp. Xin1]
MREELLRKVIRTKIEVGMHLINELPTPFGQQAKKVINILQEELSSCIQEKKQPTEKSLKRITIE